MSNPTHIPAGWYPDPSRPMTQRYWDGAAWSDHIAPMPVGPSRDAAQDSSAAAVPIGYLLAILIPLAGFILGLFLLGKSGHAAGVIGLSVFAGFMWFIVIYSQTAFEY